MSLFFLSMFDLSLSLSLSLYIYIYIYIYITEEAKLFEIRDFITYYH